MYIHLYPDVNCYVFNKQAIIHISTEVHYKIKDIGKGWISLGRGNRIYSYVCTRRGSGMGDKMEKGKERGNKRIRKMEMGS